LKDGIGIIAAMKYLFVSCGMILMLWFAALSFVYSSSATWDPNPTSGDWNTPANWTPNRVPNGPNDVATFRGSTQTQVSFSTSDSIEVGQIIFGSDASAYTVSVNTLHFLSIDGIGITNNSGIAQNFVAAERIYFRNSASAGENVVITNQPGNIQFWDTSSAGTATIINEGATVSGTFGEGVTDLLFNSSSKDATFINNPGTLSGAPAGYTLIQTVGDVGTSTFIGNAAVVSGAEGGWIEWDYGSAAGANFILNGSSVATAQGGQVYVYGGSGYATFTAYGGDGGGTEGGLIDLFDLPGSSQTVVIANGGTNGGSGATILIETDATHSPTKGQFRVYGNGVLDLSNASPPGPTIGSLEGDGLLSLASIALSIGGNNLSTIFSGTIQDTGSIVKVGTGSLTLSASNTYSGGTTVSAGTLVLTNTTGSATGTGAVQVSAGTFGGSGTIAGAVTIGTGSGTGAFLAPAYGGNKQLTLTIEGSLTFNADATYTYTFKAKGSRSRIDKVIANGVTINTGAQIALSGTAQGQLTQGLVLTLIKNTAATPISGTFSNLPDGGIVNVNGNNFQANYEGGAGNDLTLTVVP
jgi:autotransporter-associated beta strand protein